MRSKPAKEHWTDLATRGGESGREDCQAGWQSLAASLLAGRTVLDVGSGLCRVSERIGWAVTQDPAPGLPALIRAPVQDIPSASFDAVTCFDVIEHVVEDVDFLSHLCRVAKRHVFVTTPNELVSRAGNGCHCREYTPGEFAALLSGRGASVDFWAGDGAGLRPERLGLPEFLAHTRPHQAAMIRLGAADSNLGRWAPWYAGLREGGAPRPYGDTDAYRLGAQWLDGCATVEDWGCGMGWLRKFVPPQKYLGIDGTPSPFADVVADLAAYRSSPDGLFMRGVIEHERRWREVLSSAAASFTRRMALVLFTPMSETTREIAFVDELGVPDISFAHADIMPFFAGLSCRWEDIRSDTGYGGERIYYLEKP